MSDQPTNRQKRSHYTAKRHLVGFEDTSYICFFKTDEIDTLASEAHIIIESVTLSLNRTRFKTDAKHTKMGEGDTKNTKDTKECGHIEDFKSDRY